MGQIPWPEAINCFSYRVNSFGTFVHDAVILVRPYVEILYFIAGILLVYGIYIAYQQLRKMREDSNIRATREGYEQALLQSSRYVNLIERIDSARLKNVANQSILQMEMEQIAAAFVSGVADEKMGYVLIFDDLNQRMIKKFFENTDEMRYTNSLLEGWRGRRVHENNQKDLLELTGKYKKLTGEVVKYEDAKFPVIGVERKKK